ncbi:MAG: TIGR02588 family protein [Actinomycetota bacterium]|nr:TIGR02588 family protein [Actinomycetota bacterium]
MSRNGDGQSVAEWTTLGISVVVLLVLIGLVGYEYFTSGTQPPVIEVRPQVREVREVDGTYYLPVEVINEGERTAEDVKVRVSLTSDEGERESSLFTIGFLAGKDTEQEVVVFEESPTGGNLAADVESFRKP